MQHTGSNSFFRHSGKTSRESKQQRKQRQNQLQLQQKNLKTPIEETISFSSSESEEEGCFGPDKISQKGFGKSKERNISNARIKRQSKQSAVLEDYDSPSRVEADFKRKELIPFDPLICDGTIDECPHHLHWDFHKGVLPFFMQHLKQCTCWGCDYGRNKYKC